MSNEELSARSKRGHLLHGLYARDILLPWEDPEEFLKLHDSIKNEYFPAGATEDECVLDLALAHWQKRTLARLRTATVLRDPFSQEILATRKKSWSGIRKSLRKTAKQEQAAKKAMEDTFINAFSSLSRLAKKMTNDARSEHVEKLQPSLDKGLQLIRSTVLPMLREVQKIPNSEGALEKNYLPDDLEKVVRLEAMIDSRISKILARLVGIKEFKRTPAGNPPKQLAKL
jgi:hypothetical protein